AEVELGWTRPLLGEARALLAEGTMDQERRMNLAALVRYGSFRARAIEDDADASNLELATLPAATLHHAALHARCDAHWSALAERVEAVAGFLASHEENLRRGVEQGRAPEVATARAFVERILPRSAASVAHLGALAQSRAVESAIVSRLERACERAAKAHRSFGRFVEDTVLPASRHDVRLGELEVERRLHETMGLAGAPTELLILARSELTRARCSIEEEAVALGQEDPRVLIQQLCARRPPSVPDAVMKYRDHLEAAKAFVLERALLSIHEVRLDLEPLPAGIADGGAVTNWPAPLLDPDGRGHMLYATELGPHVSIAMKNLAVHEGIPGHYLQSAVWQRTIEGDRARAVRWLGVADPIAMASGYFGAMLPVEGWAVHMEQLLRQHGFYERGAETLFFSVCDAIRAARVVLDLELHAGDMDTAALERFVAEATFMSEEWARWSVLRAKRLPLQGLTYFLGEREIARHREQRPPGEPLAAFYTRLLAVGPVPFVQM
ncbi:MAG: hypothetical protein K0S65_2103, partial [Labilithrix sp.]|nr:hypothetical protein [Labilithrix sp.]